MQAMWVRERSRTLGGTVQVDEAFLGGQASGRGSLGRKGKVPFLAAVLCPPHSGGYERLKSLGLFGRS